MTELSPALAPYVIRAATPTRNLVETWSVSRLPFEPRGWLRDYRADLKRAVGQLTVEAGKVLQAAYVSDVRDAVDVENVLFYNVGVGCFTPLTHTGVKFERAYAAPPPEPLVLVAPALHYVRYAAAVPQTGFVHWRAQERIARFTSKPFSTRGEVQNPAVVWHRAKTGVIEASTKIGDPSQHFGLSISILGPSRQRLNLAAAVKSIFDGVIAAFHAHNGVMLDELSRRLGDKLGQEPSLLATMLMDERPAVLGVRQLLWKFGAGVQWNPADDRCVAGEIHLVEESRETWQLSGELMTVRSQGA